MAITIQVANTAASKRAKIQAMLDEKERLVKRLEEDLDAIPINDKTKAEREKRKETIIGWYDWIEKRYEELDKLE